MRCEFQIIENKRSFLCNNSIHSTQSITTAKSEKATFEVKRREKILGRFLLMAYTHDVVVNVHDYDQNRDCDSVIRHDVRKRVDKLFHDSNFIPIKVQYSFDGVLCRTVLPPLACPERWLFTANWKVPKPTREHAFVVNEENRNFCGKFTNN